MKPASADDRVRALSEKYGTPLYTYDREILLNRSEQLQDVLAGAVLYYSPRANPNREVAALLRSSGCRVEVASGGELKRAVEAGYKGEEIIFIGPGKTREEIITAAEVGIDKFVVDNVDELRNIRTYTGMRQVIVRVNPDFEARGGKLSMSGAKPKQFGVDRSQVADFISLARSIDIEIDGLQYYLGTRFLHSRDIIANTELIISDAASIAAECDIKVNMLDMGGGFGIPYFADEKPVDMAVLKLGLGACISEAKRLFPDAQLAFESGRFLTAECGELILKVLASKTSYGTRFCICDGGTNLNMAAIGTGGLGKRNFPSRLVTQERGADRVIEGGQPVTVTGPLCTPDDTLLKSVKWEHSPQAGDFVVLGSVGAYGPTASPHSFLGHSFPTEVLI